MPRPTLGSLEQSVAAMVAVSHAEPDPEERCIGLCVVAAAQAVRHIEEKSSTDAGRDLRVVSIQSLLSLADMVSAARLTHGEAAQLFISATSLDLVIGLLQRTPTTAAVAPAPTELQRPASVDPEPHYWLANIVRNGAATAEQFLEFVIGKRHVLGVTEAAKGQPASQPGDWVCFFVPGKGIVGHGRVQSLAEPGVNGSATLMRASDRFDRLIRLNHVELYDSAVLPPPEQQQRLAVTLGSTGTAGPVLGAITRQEFLKLTAARRERGDLRI